MRKLSFFILALLIFVGSCGKKEKEEPTYTSSYDELVMGYSDLTSLGEFTNLAPEKLVGLRYDGGKVSDDLTECLQEILKAYEKGDLKKIEKLKKKDRDFKINQQTTSISPERYIEIVAERNESFKEIEQTLIAELVSEKIDSIIDNKFGWFTWISYLFSNKDKYINKLLADFNTEKIVKEANAEYINRINQYKNTIAEEYNILYDQKVEFPDFHEIENSDIEVNEASIKASVANCIKDQMKDFLWTLFFDFIACAIVAAILNTIVSSAIDEARDKAVKEFLKNVRWNSEDGFLKNLVKTSLHALGKYGQLEEEVASIKSRYNTRRNIINTIIWIVGIIVTINVAKSQAEHENELNMQLTEKIIESSPTLSINPARILNLYIGID